MKLMKPLYTTGDLCKLLCAILVVGIHTQPLGERLEGGYIFTTICRIAVPFFFVFSSYVFFLKKSSLFLYVKRLLILELVWTFIESPLIIYKFFYADYTSLFYSSYKLLFAMLFGESYMGSWFIHASWMGMCVIFLLKNNKLLLYLIAGIALILSLLDTSYYYLLTNTSFEIYWTKLNQIIYPSESFIIAIPYMLIGKYLAENFKKSVINLNVTIAIFVLSFLLMIAESLFCLSLSSHSLELMANPRFEVFIMLPITVYFFIRVVLSYEVLISQNLSKYIRKMSILIYLTHQPLMLVIYKLGVEPVGVCFFILTVLLSVFTAVAIIKCSSIFKYLY